MFVLSISSVLAQSQESELESALQTPLSGASQFVDESPTEARALAIVPSTRSAGAEALHRESAGANLVANGESNGVVANEDASITSYIQFRAREFLRSTFEVRQVNVRGNQRIASDEVDRLLDLDQPRWVWDVIFEDLPAKLRRNPWIETAEVSWDYFPFSVQVSVQEAEPWLVAEYRGESWLVSRSGKLLQASKTLKSSEAILETAALPRLDGVELASSGELDVAGVSRRLEYALRLLRLVDVGGGVPFGVEKYSILPNGGLVVSPAETSIPKVLLAPETFDDARVQLRRLGAVLADLRDRNESAQSVDLRFADRAFVSS